MAGLALCSGGLGGLTEASQGLGGLGALVRHPRRRSDCILTGPNADPLVLVPHLQYVTGRLRALVEPSFALDHSF
jgi:hypothetical protein